MPGNTRAARYAGRWYGELHEITTSRRAITQTIAADLFDRGAGAVRFPSRLDGSACVTLFEGRGTASSAGDTVALTDPPPEPPTNVTTPCCSVGASIVTSRNTSVHMPRTMRARVTTHKSTKGHFTGYFCSKGRGFESP